MDKRSPPKSQSPGKNQPRPQRKGLPFWLLVHFLLGLVLIVAGALKLYELGFEAQDESAPTLLLMVLAEIELLGGIWMAAWFDPVRTRWWGAAAFVGLAVSSLFQTIAGKCSCGCFGSFSVNPWLVLVFDLAAVAALLGSGPHADPENEPAALPMRFLGLGSLALIVTVAGWRQADLVSIVGTVTAEGRPLVDAALTFTGGSGKIVLRTDHDGHFRLPLVRPGLYAVSAIESVSTSTPTPEKAGRLPAKRTTQRLQQRPVPARPTTDGEALRWIEIPNCSEYSKLIEF